MTRNCTECTFVPTDSGAKILRRCAHHLVTPHVKRSVTPEPASAPKFAAWEAFQAEGFVHEYQDRNGTTVREANMFAEDHFDGIEAEYGELWYEARGESARTATRHTFGSDVQVRRAEATGTVRRWVRIRPATIRQLAWCQGAAIPDGESTTVERMIRSMSKDEARETMRALAKVLNSEEYGSPRFAKVRAAIKLLDARQGFADRPDEGRGYYFDRVEPIEDSERELAAINDRFADEIATRELTDEELIADCKRESRKAWQQGYRLGKVSK